MFKKSKLCHEVKYLLEGGEKVYDCELIHFKPECGILKYVLKKSVQVAAMQLPPGTVTFGFFWVNVPYTLYVWVHAHKIIGYYFSIVDQVLLTSTSFFYRDLILDIAIDNQLNVSVLDKAELPRNLPKNLVQYINSAFDNIMRHYPEIIKQINTKVKSFTAINF